MAEYPMKVSVRKVPKNPNMFEFTISTPTLRSQFILARDVVNRLRVTLEKALISK